MGGQDGRVGGAPLGRDDLVGRNSVADPMGYAI
jgi:hypothetical protein